MPIRSLYQRVTSLYGRAGVVARHALRDIPAGPTASLSRIEDQRRMLDVVRRMPEPYRSALVNCHIDGHAPDAVARRLGVPTEVVAARLRRAMSLLNERLGRRTAS